MSAGARNSLIRRLGEAWNARPSSSNAADGSILRR